MDNPHHLQQKCVNWPTTNGDAWYRQKYDVIVGPRVDHVAIPPILTQNKITIPDILVECRRFEEELKFLLGFTFGKAAPVADEEDADVDVEGNSSGESTNGVLQTEKEEIVMIAREIQMDCDSRFPSEQTSHVQVQVIQESSPVADPLTTTATFHPSEQSVRLSLPHSIDDRASDLAHPMDAVFDLKDSNRQLIYCSDINNGERYQGPTNGALKLEMPSVDSELNFWKNDSALC